MDTPGFGDSNGNDNQYIEEMMEVLDNKLGYANTILLVLEGSVPRFSNSLYAMLRQMTSIFGETWWDFMMVGVRRVVHLFTLYIELMIMDVQPVNGNTVKTRSTRGT